jgi:M6 family metalloprotease-like protein
MGNKVVPLNKEIFPRIYCPVLFMAVAMLLGSTAGLAQTRSTNSDSPPAAHMRSLNNSLLNLHGQMQVRASDFRSLRMQAADVIEQRAAALTRLVQDEPHTALTFAFSPELLADLAAKFPRSSSQLESHATVTGPVKHWIVDYPKGARSIWQMNADGLSLNLYFSGPEPANPKSNQLLQATGVLVGSEMAVESSNLLQSSSVSSPSPNFNQPATTATRQRERLWPTLAMFVFGFAFVLPGLGGKIRLSRRQAVVILRHLSVYAFVLAFVWSSTPILAQNSCSTKGMQNTAVLLVNFSDIATTVDPATAYTDFFDTSSGRSLNGYWQEASYGQTSAGGNVFGPFTIGPSSSYTCAIFQQLSSDVLSAAIAGGVNLQNYSRIFVIFPGLSSCGWIGLTSAGSSNAGCTTWSIPAGTLTASLSYVVDNYIMNIYYPWTTSRDGAVALLAHEGGHQFGLPHSGTIDDRPTAVLEPPGTAGHITDQGDEFAVMGAHNLGLYQAQQKAAILGWMSSPTNYQTVTTSGTYTLQPIETNPPGLQALKIQRGSSPGYYLWVEYRQPIGQYDSTLAAPPLSNQPFTGAMVTYEDPYYQGPGQVPGHTYLVDFNLNDTYWTTPDLNPGQTWTDPYTNVSLSLSGTTSSGLTVAVNYGATSCNSAAPSVSVSPLDPSIYPGQSASYSVSVTNNDSSACSSSTINLGSTAPSGWFTSLSASSVTLGPGQSATVTMGKGAPSGTAAGTYAVNLSAATTSFNASGTANATVMTPPSLAVSVSTSGSTFTAPGTVSITALVTNGGAAASGANVTFTVTAPNGSNSTQTATTGSNGMAAWNYKLNGKSVAGSYSVIAQASLSSGTKRNNTSTQSATSNTVTFTVQ